MMLVLRKSRTERQEAQEKKQVFHSSLLSKALATPPCYPVLPTVRSGHHRPAFVGALAAGVGAGFTVGHVVSVFFALGSAGIAGVGADLHKRLHKLRPACCESSAKSTQVGTVAAKPDTGRHVMALRVSVAHFNAGGNAFFAGFGAGKTGFYVGGHIHCC